MDMGVYCIQGALYSTQEEPISATAQKYQPDNEFFREVPESVTFQLEFPSGAVANLTTSFGIRTNLLYVACTRARDHLLVTSVEPESEFLDDLRM